MPLEGEPRLLLDGLVRDDAGLRRLDRAVGPAQERLAHPDRRAEALDLADVAGAPLEGPAAAGLRDAGRGRLRLRRLEHRGAGLAGQLERGGRRAALALGE